MNPLLLAVLALLVTPPASANEEGIVGYAETGCGDCHTPNDTTAVSVAFAADQTTVAGGETIDLGLTVTSLTGEHLAAGLDVATSDGLLGASATLFWREYELTHQFPHSLDDGTVTFPFTWTAPAYATEVTLVAAGNAVDFTSSATGDAWGQATLVLTVEADCADADGDLVGDCEGDCDDTDATIYPGATDTWYDGVDSDCDGNDDDQDGDGLGLSEDCDDTDATVGRCDTGVPDTGVPDTGTDAEAGDDTDAPVGVPPTQTGCGCGGGASPAPGGLLVLALGMVAARGRRSTSGLS